MKLTKMHIYHTLTNLTVIIDEDNNGCIQEVNFGICNYYKRMIVPECHDALLIDKTGRIFKDFFQGKPNVFADTKINMTGKTLFQKRVLKAAQKIPWGKVVSYSDLANMAGYPLAVRAVASVMRNNHVPLIVPCHRVITKQGRLGGFMGYLSGSATDLKGKLLGNEGVQLL